LGFRFDFSTGNLGCRHAFIVQVQQATFRCRSFTMMNRTATAFLIALIAGGTVACTSTPEEGPAESTAANAGRVVDDSVITAKVKSALVADPVTKAHQINVETFQGAVQLSGFVDDAAARSRATQVAREVEGVRDVKNSLQVRSTG
jgi:osmotically-inducible protein OsmY